jgi:hypothetical protein
VGGEPRYEINNDSGFRMRFSKSLEKLRKNASKIAVRDTAKIIEKLKSSTQEQTL